MEEKMEQALNEQIREELDSAYLYLSMATYFHDQGLDGMAKWMRVQASEEYGHAMRIFDHIVERGGRVTLFALSEPAREWDSPQAAFQAAYQHEKYITGKISELVELSSELKDYPAASMLHWFVDEQVEEEASTLKIVQALERIGKSGSGLIMLDRELGKRE